MNPPLRDRLGRRKQDAAGITAPASRAAMARALFWFAASAAVLSGVTIAPVSYTHLTLPTTPYV